MKIEYLLEPHEGGESLNAVSFGKSLFVGSINLCEGNWWIVLGKNFSGAFVLWGKFLAVTTKEEYKT